MPPDPTIQASIRESGLVGPGSGFASAEKTVPGSRTTT